MNEYSLAACFDSTFTNDLHGHQAPSLHKSWVRLDSPDWHIHNWAPGYTPSQYICEWWVMSEAWLTWFTHSELNPRVHSFPAQVMSEAWLTWFTHSQLSSMVHSFPAQVMSEAWFTHSQLSFMVHSFPAQVMSEAWLTWFMTEPHGTLLPSTSCELVSTCQLIYHLHIHASRSSGNVLSLTGFYREFCC